ncbi:MAG: hydroxyacylglutathione hydrolase [Rikenellaceae bacterium]|nr:hydroxyacylglutathione hydrolase [Rikenellaceae bacterium]
MKLKLFVCNPFTVNNYIISNDNNDALLIDAGYYSDEEWETLQNYLTLEHLNVKACLITHPHIDHVIGISGLYQKYNIEILMSEAGYHLYESIVDVADQFGMEQVEILAKDKIKFINEGNIKIGDFDILVYETPGHADGSLCFYVSEEKIIFTGDVLFYDSVGRTDFITGDWDALVNSIKNKLYKLPDEVKVYPGHGNPTSIGHEKHNNPFVKIN